MKWLFVASVCAVNFLRREDFFLQSHVDGKDPNCKTGILSLDVGGASPQQVCCPTYCKECGDYPTCNAAFGENTKDSSDACCASKVAVAPEVKSCDESLPPCKLTKPDFSKPKPSSAEDDCGKARDQANKQMEAAVAAGHST
eukprot:GEMP01064504.1.p1 GENE.GEMP01064504.1~~GEMP01064504.1.p1  ORF type:complete len:142 (+),score=38.21 GEMP01064504.1:146-571(+)